MRGDLNENTLFATVAMARSGTAELILVVEGEDDHLLVERHSNSRQLVVIQGVGGRGNVLAAAQRAEESSLKGVRFLVDSDYDRFSRPGHAFPGNVIASTNHDAMIDVVLLSPLLLTQVVDTHCRAARRSGALIDAKTACSDAFKLASALAPLRILNERMGYELRLDDFPFGSISSVAPSAMEIAKLALSRSRPSVAVDMLAAEIDEEVSRIDMSDLRLIGDHDYFAALARVLDWAGAKIRSKALWTGFLAAVMCEHVARAAWFEEVREWGSSNSREVIKCPCAI